MKVNPYMMRVLHRKINGQKEKNEGIAQKYLLKKHTMKILHKKKENQNQKMRVLHKDKRTET
jgi:hypothetical protein